MAVLIVGTTKPIAQNQTILQVLQSKPVSIFVAQPDHGLARRHRAPVVRNSKPIRILPQMGNPGQTVEPRAGVEQTPKGTPILERLNGLEHGMSRFLIDKAAALTAAAGLGGRIKRRFAAAAAKCFG